MKKGESLLFALSFILLACNNAGKDSVEKADSVNEAKLDSSSVINPPPIATDEETSSFLVKAANGGMEEMQLGEIARQKAVNQKVKDFGAMMIKDHSAENDLVKSLSARRNVTLPTTVGDEEKKEINNLNKKSGAGFDRAYMKSIIRNHNKKINLFENASDKVKDTEVKTFIDNALPQLRNYLDSAKAIQKGL
jgi:putative membrane protein